SLQSSAQELAGLRLAARPRILAKELRRRILALGHDLAKEIEILPAHVGPEHWLGILVGSAPRFSQERGVRQKSQRCLGHCRAIAKGHKQSPSVGEDFFGIEIR